MFYYCFLNIELFQLLQAVGYTMLLIFSILIFSLISTILILKMYKKDSLKVNDEFEIAGFAYEEKQDIFYSVIDAWQRDYGYCHFYDEIATPISLVVDSEPIIFKYNNKLWLIELWKGQYGMTTGAEIGIYNTNIKYFRKNKKKIVFNSVTDAEMLEMSYILYKNNNIYFERFGKHWWLTGFKLGDFANPEDLKVNININFKDLDMRDAFIKELFKIGYTSDKVAVNNTLVNIIFDKPYTKKPFTRMRFLDNIAQKRNKFFVDTYQKMTRGATTFTDKINLLKQNNPKLYKRIMNIGLSKKIYTTISYLKRNHHKGGD